MVSTVKCIEKEVWNEEFHKDSNIDITWCYVYTSGVRFSFWARLDIVGIHMASKRNVNSLLDIGYSKYTRYNNRFVC